MAHFEFHSLVSIVSIKTNHRRVLRRGLLYRRVDQKPESITPLCEG